MKLKSRNARERRQKGYVEVTPVSELFSTPGRVEVLRALTWVDVPVNGRELARAAGVGPQTCTEALAVLEKMGVVKRSLHGGKARIVINTSNPLVTGIILPLFEKEAEVVQRMHETRIDKMARGLDPDAEEEELDP